MRIIKTIRELRTTESAGIPVQTGNLYKVQVGAYSVKSNAGAMKKAGYDAFITAA
jgi:hypothetical protein